MKKYLWCLICAVFMCACSNDIETEARSHMENAVKQLAKDPNPHISDVEIVFKTKDLIVLQCIVKGMNSYGGYSTSNVEYIYGIMDKGKRMESVQILGEKESVLERCEKIYQTVKAENPDDDSFDREQNMIMQLTLELCFSGREV